MSVEETYYRAHKGAYEEWPYGNLLESWNDENGDLCIRYETGAWWHYKRIGEQIIWW